MESSYTELPSITPDTKLDDTNERQKELEYIQVKKFIEEHTGYFEPQLLQTGEIMPVQDVTGIPDKKEDHNERAQVSWMTPHALVLYLAWEQGWWIRDEKGKNFPISAVDLYKLVYQEYDNIDRTGYIRGKILEKEKEAMRKIYSKEEEEDDSSDQEYEKECEGDDDDIDYEKLGLPRINESANCRDKPYKVEDLLRSVSEKRKNNTGNKPYWFSPKEEDLASGYILPDNAKLSFTMTFNSFLQVLRDLEEVNYLDLRPVKRQAIGDTTIFGKPYTLPSSHFSIFFSIDRGYDIWKDMKNPLSTMPNVVKRYHSQRVKRFSYLSEAELIDGEIYNKMKKSCTGNIYDNSRASLERKRKRIK